MSGLKSLYAKQRVRNPTSPYCSKCSRETFFNSSFPLANLSKITLSAPYQRADSVLDASVDFLPEPQTWEGSVACISETTASAARQLGLTSVYHPSTPDKFCNYSNNCNLIFISPQVGELAGIVVGATVMLNILIAGPLTGASMNSSRTLGPAMTENNYQGIWIYLTAPILGALAGAGIYTTVKLPEEDDV
uniref:Uncharacterized protein n=1 Tax=Lactuca sativa TaxID=4236 RepID=A0A9R1UH13_LACSA|nr:hypothetical protein LSAT_V11C900467950 [Lactuca sativa]